MSLTSWKEEFYLVDAFEVPAEQALAHSHRKWIGLRPENLAKHGGGISASHISFGDGVFYFNSRTCALCRYYLVYEVDSSDRCRPCPLYKANGGRPCDLGYKAPYGSLIHGDDPKPMIDLIEKAISSTVAERTQP